MRHWYEGFLGMRYLRASPKPGFVSLIAGIAILGLTVGVAVLIIVLSVMNGFEGELKKRILSLTAHATISGLEARIPDWRPDLDKLNAYSQALLAKLRQMPKVADADSSLVYGKPELRVEIDRQRAADLGVGSFSDNAPASCASNSTRVADCHAFGVAQSSNLVQPEIVTEWFHFRR